MHRLNSILLLFCTLPLTSLANTNTCFSNAESYYEQIYCEIKSQSTAIKLPSFIDFKKNSEQMQALLLKRKAASLGIKMKMPNTSKARKSEISSPSTLKSKAAVEGTRVGCSLNKDIIHCSNARFTQTGNKHNRHLDPIALSEKNQLQLEEYSGNMRDQPALIKHLTKQYIQYLEKMLVIGLGGETMSFTKFYTLFHDLRSKGVSFAQRFQTMYQFLKKDKTNIGVSERIFPLANISINHCAQLTEQIFTCDNKLRNTIYLKQ